jgi:hypothetical protein
LFVKKSKNDKNDAMSKAYPTGAALVTQKAAVMLISGGFFQFVFASVMGKQHFPW